MAKIVFFVETAKKKGDFFIIPPSLLSFFLLDFVQCLSDVVKQVFNIFYAHREADEVRSHPRFAQLLVAELSVCVAGRVQDAGLGICYMGYDVDEI